MKLFNIINESKSFILLLLFTFTLAITSQSFATSVNSPEDLNKLCKGEDLTTLNAANKEKCVGWCKIKTNWVEKCAKIGVKETLFLSIGKPGEDDEAVVDDAAGIAGEKEDIPLKTRIIKALNGLDDIATGLKVPDSYNNNIYSFKIKLDQSQRPTLFEHMKPKEPSTDADAIDKTLVSDTMKEILLDGLGYSDLKADGTNNDDKLEKFFIDFRNKWLKFEAKGSVNLNTEAFEPSAFKALQAVNHVNQGPMHRIYNMLEDGQKVFSANKYDIVINDAADVATDLKNLRDAIVTFLKDKLIVAGADTWAPNTDLEFSIKLATLRASLETFLDGLDAEAFNVTTRADFDKIKHYLTEITLTTGDNVDRDDSKDMAGDGLLVLSGGDFNYELNPEKVEAAVLAAGGGGVAFDAAMNFTADEKNTQEYKVYAARLKAFEAGLKAKFASGIDYGIPADGSLLHKITEFVRDDDNPEEHNSAFDVNGDRNMLFSGIVDISSAERNIHKVGIVGGKWVVLIYANTANNQTKTKMQMITEAPDAGNPPRFTVQALSTYESATFWGTAASPRRANPHHHTFDALIGNGLEVGTNLFAQEKLLTRDIVYTGNNDIHDATASSAASPLKLIKFRFMNTHGLPDRSLVFRPDSNDFKRILNNFYAFLGHFVNNDTFGTDTDKVFAELTALSPSLGQLYAFHRFIAAIDLNHVIVPRHLSHDVPNNDADGSAGRHCLSSHVLNPPVESPNDVTFVLTSRLQRVAP